MHPTQYDCKICLPPRSQPAAAAGTQQVPLPEERSQVAARLLCSRVRSVKEAYEVRCGPVWLQRWLQLLKAGAGRSLLMVCCSSCLGDARSLCAAASALQEWYVGRWPSGAVVQAIESIRVVEVLASVTRQG
jgi:hypothetical protein